MQNPGSHLTSGTGIFYPKKRTHVLIETNGRLDWNERMFIDTFYFLYFLHKAKIFCMLFFISFINELAYNAKIVKYAIIMLFIRTFSEYSL